VARHDHKFSDFWVSTCDRHHGQAITLGMDKPAAAEEGATLMGTKELVVIVFIIVVTAVAVLYFIRRSNA
jgi:hypothetical protein